MPLVISTQDHPYTVADFTNSGSDMLIRTPTADSADTIKFDTNLNQADNGSSFILSTLGVVNSQYNGSVFSYRILNDSQYTITLSSNSPNIVLYNRSTIATTQTSTPNVTLITMPSYSLTRLDIIQDSVVPDSMTIDVVKLNIYAFVTVSETMMANSINNALESTRNTSAGGLFNSTNVLFDSDGLQVLDMTNLEINQVMPVGDYLYVAIQPTNVTVTFGGIPHPKASSYIYIIDPDDFTCYNIIPSGIDSPHFTRAGALLVLSGIRVTQPLAGRIELYETSNNTLVYGLDITGVVYHTLYIDKSKFIILLLANKIDIYQLSNNQLTFHSTINIQIINPGLLTANISAGIPVHSSADNQNRFIVTWSADATRVYQYQINTTPASVSQSPMPVLIQPTTQGQNVELPTITRLWANQNGKYLILVFMTKNGAPGELRIYACNFNVTTVTPISIAPTNGLQVSCGMDMIVTSNYIYCLANMNIGFGSESKIMALDTKFQYVNNNSNGLSTPLLKFANSKAHTSTTNSHIHGSIVAYLTYLIGWRVVGTFADTGIPAISRIGQTGIVF